MDRIVSDEERIRRAEEVIERRNNTDLRISSNSFVKEKQNSKIKKILIQILICLIIYCGIYYINNSKNEQVKSIIGNISDTLGTDLDFKSIYDNVCAQIKKINWYQWEENKNDSEENNQVVGENSTDNSEKNNQVMDENSTDNSEGNNQVVGENSTDNSSTDLQDNNELSNEVNTENSESIQNNISYIESNGDNLGIGGEFSDESYSLSSDEDQMKIDADYISKKIEIINPLKCGVVTSRFGVRNSSKIVSSNHKGIDLGAVTGSSIVAASDGKVIEASSEGDFGIHLKVQKDDIIMIYAHCSKLLVKEGDCISKGQHIAEVGSTGKATGPHLHFEIRRENRAVDPELVLEF